ncbi:GNAT family N-acetyltransferase [Streptomyces lavendulae]|uniref:GNAT family N-acetyltransferase n=1 Tax=Streptomyces lavendulae TaxID=1914 RepID=UPI003695CC89
MHCVYVRPVPFDHPHATQLNARVQLEYAERFGEPDVAHLDDSMFTPPRGLYLIVYDDESAPLASGGWRSQDEAAEGYMSGDAEIKRMYVIPEARGFGLSRRVLATLEDDARAKGRVRMVLSTSIYLPEAISLYTSSGYEPCAKFGHCRSSKLSRCFSKPLHPQAL